MPEPVTPGDQETSQGTPPVQVVRSTRRVKTAQARFVDGRIKVMVPASMSDAEERACVDRLVAQIQRRRASSRIDLPRRARALAQRLGLPRPRTIEWSDRQALRWGSCSVTDGSIRISTRVAGMPGWVLDAVIVHELAHLVVPHHGDEFHELAGRYELTERARGYLIARAETG